jgi:hypothetical protein
MRDETLGIRREIGLEGRDHGGEHAGDAFVHRTPSVMRKLR